MRELVRRDESGTFVALTFGLAWGLWWLSGVLGRGEQYAVDLRWAVAQMGVCAPALAGVLVATCVEAGAGRDTLRALLLVYAPVTVLAFAIAASGPGSIARLGPWWTVAIAAFGVWVVCWFASRSTRPVRWLAAPASRATVALWTTGSLVVPGLVFLTCWFVTSPTPPAPTEPPFFVRALTPVGIGSALAVNLVLGGSLGEEPGWRGVWLTRLLHAERPLAASPTVGGAWALWHAPIDIAQGFGAAGPLAMAAAARDGRLWKPVGGRPA